jgi:hypothetical protein
VTSQKVNKKIRAVLLGVLGKSYCSALFLYSFEILYQQTFLSGGKLISEPPFDTASAG